MLIKTTPFDAAEYLTEPADHAALLADAVETGDTGYMVNALGIIARARGMSQVARALGFRLTAAA